MDSKKGPSYLLPQRALCFIAFCLLALPVALVNTATTQDRRQTSNTPYTVGTAGVGIPVALYQPLPAYTKKAIAFQIEGIVLVQAVVRKDGTVDSFKILRGLGYGLDESAIKTIGSAWRFQPGTLNGEPVDVQTNIEISFRLFQKPQDRGKLNEYPLRAQIIRAEWKEELSGDKTGTGYGNLWTRGSPRAFAYTHRCDPLFQEVGDFPAKWKEPESRLEAVTFFEPRTEELRVCEFQVAMQDGISQSPGSAAAETESSSTSSSQPIPAPDLRFYEVEVSYPLFRRSFRLVPQEGLPRAPGVRTSLFRLVEDPSVPQGTSMGPQERSGAPAPISTASCQSPLIASLQVWVKNEGTVNFWAESPELGLTGSVDGIAIEESFNTVEAGKTIYFETRPFELRPGLHTYKLVLNAEKGKDEQNFQNNSFEGRFEITCTSTAEQNSSHSRDSSLSAKLYDVETGAAVQVFSGSGRSSSFASFSPDGSKILTGWPGIPTLWDVKSGQKIAFLKKRSSCIPSASAYSSMSMVSFSPDGRKAITANADSGATVWDVETQSELQTYCSDNQPGVTFVDLVSGGSEALIGRAFGPAVWMDVDTGKIARTLNFKGPIMAVSPDGNRIVSAGGVYDASAGGITCSFPNQTRAAFSRDGRTVVAVSSDALTSWDASTCALKAFIKNDQESLYDISPDGRMALTGKWDDQLKLWDLQARRLLRALPGPVRGAAFSPDSKKILALGYGDRQGH